jgi:uncharacterized protein YxjI
MSIPAPETGWSRYVVTSKFGAGRDFTVTGLDGRPAFIVDGKLGVKPRAEVRDAADAVVYEVAGRMLGIPKRMTITDGAGTEVASLKAQMFSPIKSRMTLEVAGGQAWELEGTFLEKEYTISRAGVPVVMITQKWVTIRDTYTVDVAEGADVGLALAVLWAVDRWVERD